MQLAAALDARTPDEVAPLRAPGEVAGQVASEYAQAVHRAREAQGKVAFDSGTWPVQSLTMAQAIEMAIGLR